MSLKQMIDEAKMLADSRPASVAASMEDINIYRRSSDAKTPIQSDFEARRSQSLAKEQEAEKEAQRRWEQTFLSLSVLLLLSLRGTEKVGGTIC